MKKTNKNKNNKTNKAKTNKTKQTEAKIITVSGSRKRSVARATIKPGIGAIKINSKPIDIFNQFQQLILSEPIVIAEPILKDKLKQLNIKVNVKGGGVESQIEASRLAIARALVAFTKNPELRSAFIRYDKTLLVADTRRKEMRKWGDSKARAKRQKSKR